MHYKIEELAANELQISFLDRLDIDTVASLWQPCVAAVKARQPRLLILNCIAINYCDGAGIALLQALQQIQSEADSQCIIAHLEPKFQRLLDYIEQQPGRVVEKSLAAVSLPTHLGRVTVDILYTIHENIIFLGKVIAHFFALLTRSTKIRRVDFVRIMEDTGPGALPIIALIGFLIGLISTFQAEPSFDRFGAQIYMVNLVGLGLVREMGPLLTAVLLAGRTASAFAAELGTMKINAEINALTTMGLNPFRFLIIPRILATMIVTPILEAFFIVFGLLGCWLVMWTLGYTADAFFHQLRSAIDPIDYFGGLIKVFFFGLVIAGVGCLHGIKTRFGAQAVGCSTTQAVVSSLIMLVVVDGIFAVAYYILDI